MKRRAIMSQSLLLSIKPKARARPGFEPGTSRTLSENHTPRPTSQSVTYFALSIPIIGGIPHICESSFSIITLSTLSQKRETGSRITLFFI